MKDHTPREKPFNLIYEAEWNDIPCADYPLTPEKWVAECIRPLVNTQVDTLFYNLCSSDGYCCQLQNGQILMDNFEKLGDAWVWRYRENTKRLIECGANPPDLACKYGHQLNLKVLPVVRMNDPHDMYYKYEVSAFKLENPHLLIGHDKGYADWEKGWRGHPDKKSIACFTWGLFDYAHEEVRRHKLAIVGEFVTRWDNDGISLDFDRDPWLFKEEGDPKNAEIMTAFIGQVRAILDGTAKERGRPMYLHVRVIPDVDACLARGMDVRRWVEEGLVDAISPGCGYMTFSLDLDPWLEMVEGKPCWIYPCNNHWKTAEVARAWAKLMYHRGAHGLYLFNWGHLLYGFDPATPPASARVGTVYYDNLHPCYYEVLRQIGKARTLEYRDATYALESAPHELMEGQAGLLHRRFRGTDAIELPIELAVGRHTVSVPFAEDLDGARVRGFSPRVTLRLKLVNYTSPDELQVFVNQTRLDPAKRRTQAVFIMSNDTWIEYPLDNGVLNPGVNELTLDVRSLNPQMSVTPVLSNVELVVKY